MNVLQELAAVFSPNRAVSKRVTLGVIAFQTAFLLIIWISGMSPVIPRPGEVVTALSTLFSEGLGVDLASSILTNAKAIGLSTAISLILSYLTVVSFFKFPALLVSKGRFLGLAGLTFLFTVTLGGGEILKISLLVFGMTVFLTDSLTTVVAEIPRDEYDYARTLRMGPWRVVWEVVILGRLDSVFEMVRQNAAIGWVMLSMVEGIVRTGGGLGKMLLDENKHMNLAAVFAIQFLILAIGLTQDYAIGVFKNIVCPYAKLATERR